MVMRDFMDSLSSRLRLKFDLKLAKVSGIVAKLNSSQLPKVSSCSILTVTHESVTLCSAESDFFFSLLKSP